MQVDWDYHYYLANRIWYYGNVIMILPFLTACFFRFRHSQFEKKLRTDHLARVSLAFTCLFYCYECVIKYVSDGGDTVCQKGFFIHHFSSLFVITPIVLNTYIPWWVNPVGFLHGFCIFFPENQEINYIYAVAVMYFHYRLYQSPEKKLKYYGVTRIAINGIWVFCIYLLIGDCSNFLPLSPD